MWIALVCVLGVVAVLIIGDRVAVKFAENKVSDLLVVNAGFEQNPDVTVHGFPFLTQAVRGVYRDIEISGSGLQLGDIKGASVDVDLKGVHLPLSDVLHQSVDQLPVDRIEGEVTLPYDEIARLIGVPGLTLSQGSNGGVKVTLSASVPIFGTIQASGTAEVTVSGSSLSLKVTQLSALGVSVPQSVLNVLGQSIQVPVQIPPLPYGLTVSSVTAGESGIVVHGGAQDVVLKADGS